MRAPNLTHGHFVGGAFVRFPHVCPGSRCAILSWLQSKPLRVTEREFFDQKSERIVTDSEVIIDREGSERINESTAGNAAAPHCDAGSH
jgi:hypothetical protein